MSQKAARKQRAAKTPPPVRKGGGGPSIPRTWLYAGVAALAVIVVVVLVVVSQTGGDGEAAPTEIDGTATAALLDGIPQDGTSLGDPDAPVVLVEFADMQCPFCQKFAVQALPDLVDEYVRTGDVRIVFRGMTFIGPDSEKAVRAVHSAGEQDRLWYVEHMLFEHQGGENDGWVTDDLLRGIGAATPGLDVDQMMADRESATIDARIDEDASEAQANEVGGTPSFLVGPAGGTLQPFQPESLSADAFRPKLDELLGK